MLAVISVALILSGAAAGAASYEDKDCLSCHSTEITSKKLNRVIGRVDSSMFAGTPHIKLKCYDCHSTAVLSDKPKRHMESVKPVDCGQCHFKGNTRGAPNKDIAIEYGRGIHGRQRAEQHNKDVPYCKDCHGFHTILPAKDPNSPVNKLQLYKTCGKCHGDAAMMTKYKLKTDIITKYSESAHGQGSIRMGLNVTAVCSDCHGAHDVQPPTDPVSPMNRRNIPVICGKCHQGIYIVYVTSIHGSQWAKGNKDVPVCTDCHGEHNIEFPSSTTSSVNPQNIGNTCSKCHEAQPLMNKYDLPMNRLASFKSSFHGTALQLNNLTVANCASCHGSHNILPSSDPNSTINEKNLSSTCGRCHPKALKNKKIGKVHVAPSPIEDKILFYVRTIYILMITGTIGGFIFFIALDLYGARRRRKKGIH